MVFGFFDEAPPEVVEFLGMDFECNQAYFIQTIKEEIEVLLLPIYMNLWFNVKVLIFIGWFPLLDKSTTLAYALRERWNSRVNAISARGINQYATYLLF